MHKELQQENESEWLLELRQLHSVDVAHANANIEPEQHVPSTSFDVVSEIQDSRCGSVAGESPALKAPALEQHTNPEGILQSTIWTKTILNITKSHSKLCTVLCREM